MRRISGIHERNNMAVRKALHEMDSKVALRSRSNNFIINLNFLKIMWEFIKKKDQEKKDWGINNPKTGKREDGYTLHDAVKKAGKIAIQKETVVIISKNTKKNG